MFKGLDTVTELGRFLQETEFTFSPGMVPLNHGSFGAVPNRIQELQKRLLVEMQTQPYAWFMGKDYTYWKESVETVSAFLHCDPQDLVFVTNVTEGVNTVLKSCRFQDGDIILSTSLTYSAVTLTCQHVAADKGIRWEALDIQFPIDSEEDILQMYEEYFKTHPTTRIAVIDYITGPSAVMMPVKKLSKLCRKYRVMSLIDGAHAPGQVPVNLEDIDVDFFTGNFHKWMFTPCGCAVLYAQRNHHGWLKPLVTSVWSNRSFGEQFSKTGTCDKIPLICAKYAVEFVERLGGMEHISSYTSLLSTEAVEYLVDVLGTETLQIPKSMVSPNMKAFRLPDANFDKPQFQKSTGMQISCVDIQGEKYVRLSTAVYNYFDEYEKLGETLAAYCSTPVMQWEM